MPVARCLVPGKENVDPERVVEAWSRFAKVSSEEMTLVVETARWGGKRYVAVAWLFLPSLWKREQVQCLQEALARALGESLGVSNEEVMVITQMLESGTVVDGGRTVSWDERPPSH